MLLSDYHFDLPPELIAQHAAEPRDHARLLVLDPGTGTAEHRRFHELPAFLRPGDLLVLNDTKVVPARVFALRATGGRVELLLVREERAGVWDCVVGGGRKLKPGDRLALEGAEGAEGVRLVECRAPGRWSVDFGERDVRALLAHAGRAPLPPYIRRPRGGTDPDREADLARYQTVYARSEGAIAAPTAGLHFTPELLERLRGQSVGLAHVTLHVGPGTFRPITAERVEDHRLESEPFELTLETWRRVEGARAAGRRVIAVGTTVTRVLETVARMPWTTGESGAGSASASDTFVRQHGDLLTGRSTLFVHAPFDFRVLGGLVTNFHLPDGTPLLLAAAFAGRERLLAAYRVAVAERYRFFSYGDAMFVTGRGE
ncbi:MAG: tRNA preQ1(34) S-adenosylmethionine ribosyltransferase-isomerase QueA [Planctomycetes bacterium]|nr:tRNA preQ1(34) S-adenosylmethionine ribosyltransferase-isomerase QueA [Planctomycetota bacterium]